MAKITVGYQDGCLAPLWLSTVGTRIATLAGADAVWVPDHFMGFAPKWMWKEEIVPAAKVVHSMDALFDPVPIMTLFAARHRRALIGTSVTEPIRRHPMSLAQTFVTIDHISKGRAVLGIGNGLRENTHPYGLPSDRRVSRLEEALTILDLLLGSEGKPIDYDGKFWKLDGAVFDLPLYEGRRPSIYLGAHFPRMLRLTGRFGDGWLPGQKVGGDVYAERLGIIRGAAEAAGRSFDGFVPGQTLLVAFGKSRDAVAEIAVKNPYVAYMAMGLPPETWTACGVEHPMGDEFGGFLDIVPSEVTPEQIDRALAFVNRELLEQLFYMGSPEEIAADARELAAAGCRHFIVANMGGAFTGDGAVDFYRMAKLFRLLRRLPT